MQTRNRRVGIIGAGVVGLSTALAIKENLSGNIHVDIICDNEYSSITSYGPPGLLRPHVNHEPQGNWARWSLQRAEELWARADSPQMGIQMVSGYVLGTHGQIDYVKSQVTGFEKNFSWLNDDELKIFGPNIKYGFQSTTFTTEGKVYGPWLREQLKQQDVTFKYKHLNSIDELCADYDVVVNCGGLEGGRLGKEENQVWPVRGVLLEVKAPWIKHFMTVDESLTYCIPGFDTLYLGGLRQKGRWDSEITDVDRNDILQRTQRMMPSLKGAQIVREWCGLRPYRREPRVERDPSYTQNTVIHNYGHEAMGLPLPGAAPSMSSTSYTTPLSPPNYK